MQSIRNALNNIFPRCLLLIALIGTGACAPVGQKTSEIPATEIPQTPNPYLAQAGKVPREAQQRMQQARDAYAQGDLAAAESGLRAITEQWPQLSGPWLNLGIVYRKQQSPEQAEQSLRQAIAANDINIYAWNELATLLRDGGRFDEAREAYQQALKRWPAYADAHRNLGILFDLYLQQPQQALHHYRAAQASQAEADKQLAGWIVELERRL